MIDLPLGGSGLPSLSDLPNRSDLPAAGTHVHLVGAAGAGMRGLAALLHDAGYRISGCDGAAGQADLRLGAGLQPIVSGHDVAHLRDVDLVVHTSAVPEDHPELEAAARLDIPVMKRSRALAALLNECRLAAIAGTHGKTSITALAGLACTAAGLDPVVAVGGHVTRWGGFARPGSGDVAVVEADEYDRSFLQLDPSLVLVSSVEPEHLDTYGGFDALRRAFRVVAERALDRDGLLYCADEPGARRLGDALGGTSYGLTEDADYRVEVLGREGLSQRCCLMAPGGEMAFRLEVPGDHNAQNAAGALAIALRMAGPLGTATEAGLPGLAPPYEAELIANGVLGAAFDDFGGVERRLQQLADDDGVAFLDDYAHHPTEIEASLAAVRQAYPGRRLVAIFQPHLYSRTQMFATELAAALKAADEAFVLPIYPAREAPIPGVDSGLIADASGGSIRLATEAEALVVAGAQNVPAAVVFMGAGDVTALAHRAADERAHAVGD
jgi:UDP-N-acetylmuramate--alanine ligase